MLTDEEIERIAEAHVRDTYSADCEILYREKRSAPDGVYFVANRRTDPYIGTGGFFVVRGTGEIWEIGTSASRSLDDWLQWYDEGWRPGLYRLTLREVMEPRRFAGLMVRQGVSYLVREIECGTVWERMAAYDEKTVLWRIKSLPCHFIVTVDQLRAMRSKLESERIAAFEYTHAGAQKKYDWRPENNSPEQLLAQFEWA
ncbi:MAG TPA: hypothetical protein VFE33_04505 [Thermoanaerobaculia bacterium]|nr:hypothetical protein [Thermoanaerobaculia bacterium]